jgi:hypothetical protein
MSDKGKTLTDLARLMQLESMFIFILIQDAKTEHDRQLALQLKKLHVEENKVCLNLIDLEEQKMKLYKELKVSDM